MPTKILVVDDEPDLELLFRQRFRKQIREKRFEFAFAHNGEEALKLLGVNADVELVLSDINMPVMDGLTLLGRLDSVAPGLKTVIVSAYGDLTNIRTAMNRGAFDFITKPIDFGDVEVTIDKTLKHVAAIKAAAKDREALTNLQRDLKTAATIQESILPRDFPLFPHRPDVDIYARMIPARDIGGDFYDFFELDAYRIAIVIGDVSGKGIPAALFMAVARTLVRAVASETPSAGACMTRVNDLLARENTSAMFVTLFIGILDTRTGELQYANGGHNPPYILSPDGGIEPVPETGDMLVGAIDGNSYKTQVRPIPPGSSLFLYTDGVSEAMDPSDNLFGVPRLESFLTSLDGGDAKLIVDRVASDVRAFADGAAQSDDITVAVVRRVRR